MARQGIRRGMYQVAVLPEVAAAAFRRHSFHRHSHRALPLPSHLPAAGAAQEGEVALGVAVAEEVEEPAKIFAVLI